MGCCGSKSDVLKPIRANQSYNMSSYEKPVSTVPRYPKGKALLLKRIKQ